MSGSIFKESSYFKGIEENVLDKVFNAGKLQSFSHGELIIDESKQSGHVFYVQKGRVDVSISLVGSQEREIIATITEHGLVGELALLDRTRRSATVFAKGDVELLCWHKDELLDLCQKDKYFGYLFMRNIACQLAERLANTNQALRNSLASY